MSYPIIITFCQNVVNWVALNNEHKGVYPGAGTDQQILIWMKMWLLAR